jgi:hypothetical protein
MSQHDLLDFLLKNPIILQRVKRGFLQGQDSDLVKEMAFLKYLNDYLDPANSWQLFKVGGNYLHDTEEKEQTVL